MQKVENYVINLAFVYDLLRLCYLFNI